MPSDVPISPVDRDPRHLIGVRIKCPPRCTVFGCEKMSADVSRENIILNVRPEVSDFNDERWADPVCCLHCQDTATVAVKATYHSEEKAEWMRDDWLEIEETASGVVDNSPSEEKRKSICHFCHASNDVLELHHIVPRRFGGSDEPENLITVCPTCHQKLERLYDKRFYERIQEQAD